jgi:phosphate transport system substrate-binding protein
MGLRTFFAIILILVPSLRAGGDSTEASQPARVRVAGSRLILPLVEAWGRQLAERGIVVEAQGRGSSTGPPALLVGRADVASMSHPMQRAELEAFRRRVDRYPAAIPVAIDAVAVLVHASNPLERLTLSELDAVFSTTHYCGAAASLSTWGELGVPGEWAERRIGLYGGDWSSATQAFMRSVALCGGLFRTDVRAIPGGASAVKSIAESRYGIGYVSRGQVTTEVKLLALARSGDEPFLAPTAESVASGAYPLSRKLLLYVSRAGGGEISPAVDAFIRHALSESGRAVVEQHGYVPPPPESIQASLATLEE